MVPTAGAPCAAGVRDARRSPLHSHRSGRRKSPVVPARTQAPPVTSTCSSTRDFAAVARVGRRSVIRVRSGRGQIQRFLARNRAGTGGISGRKYNRLEITEWGTFSRPPPSTARPSLRVENQARICAISDLAMSRKNAGYEAAILGRNPRNHVRQDFQPATVSLEVSSSLSATALT